MRWCPVVAGAKYAIWKKCLPDRCKLSRCHIMYGWLVDFRLCSESVPALARANRTANAMEASFHICSCTPSLHGNMQPPLSVVEDSVSTVCHLGYGPLKCSRLPSPCTELASCKCCNVLGFLAPAPPATTVRPSPFLHDAHACSSRHLRSMRKHTRRLPRCLLMTRHPRCASFSRRTSLP